MFEHFAEQIAKYDDGVHRLYPPASEETLLHAQSELGYELPPDYKAFLRKWNGGLLFAKEFHDLHLWPVWHRSLQGVAEYSTNLVRDNHDFVVREGHPPYMLVIGMYSDGNLVCLDLRCPGKVCLWLRDEKEVEQEWDTLEEWLEAEMELGAELYDYHGNELEP